MVKNMPASAGDAVGKIPWRRKWLGSHSSILAWQIPRTEEPGRFVGSPQSRTDLATNFSVI